MTAEDPYPALPEHDACLASEVFEHLLAPMRAYENIGASLVEGGLLYGRFQDHGRGRLHVSRDLSEIRTRLAAEYEPMGENYIWRKRAA